MALFGPDLLPRDSDLEAEGGFAHEAFCVARTYRATPMNSPEQALLMAAAVAVHRATVKRQEATTA